MSSAPAIPANDTQPQDPAMLLASEARRARAREQAAGYEFAEDCVRMMKAGRLVEPGEDRPPREIVRSRARWEAMRELANAKARAEARWRHRDRSRE